MEKERKEEAPEPASLPVASRNWLELPELVLHSIFILLVTFSPDLLLNLHGLLSFSSVCRYWRSFSTSATSVFTSPTYLPPLLLHPLLSSPSPTHDRHLRRFRPKWSSPPHCDLQTLNTLRNSQSKILPETLTLTCIGYSHGRLIFVSGRTPLLADVFSGELTRILPPPVDFLHFRLALLAGDRLFLTSGNLILSHRLGTQSWSRISLDFSRYLNSLVAFRRQVFALDSLCRLIALDFEGGNWEPVEVKKPSADFDNFVTFDNFDQHLFECGGELLLLRFDNLNHPFVRQQWRIGIYRLDFQSSAWVKKVSLGDWCLFLDAIGRCPVACPDPTRWGGLRNCLYLARPGCDGWAAIPLDGDIVGNDRGVAPLDKLKLTLPRWPSPVWVYPSMFFGTKTN